MISFRRRVPALLAGFALAGVSAAAPAAPQQRVPRVAFTWAVEAEDLGQVSLPAGWGGGWVPGPLGTSYRPVPSFGADPTFEVVVRAPQSGHPLYAERFLVQFPADFLLRPFQERALVIGCHSFGVSEKEIFLSTDLPYECAQRGWMLLAPYGLNDSSFANVQSQASLQAIVRILHQFVPFNYRRVYAVGFSMGGLTALSFAMRHLDPRGVRVAAAVVHTATLDMVQEYEGAGPGLRALLANSVHFGAGPELDPFAYERVSPARFLASGLVDPERAPVTNLLHLPIVLHANLADPEAQLVADMAELKSYLLLRGAIVHESMVYDPAAGHSWSTLDLTLALDTIAPASAAGATPPAVELFADRPGRWHHLELRAQTPGAHARLELELAPVAVETVNSFALLATHDLDVLALELQRLGLDVAQPLAFLHAAADGSADQLVLVGYASAPAAVLVDGVLAPFQLEHDPQTAELRVTPTADGHACRVDVTP